MQSTITTQAKEEIILGIDPGTSVMGYGIILVQSKTPKILQYGVIHLKKYDNHALKLKKIFEKVLHLIDDFNPDHIALEAPFYGKNVQSMLKLGRAQGVAMAAALSKEIAITEYAPKKIKQAITGNGNAAKEQVAYVLEHILKTKLAPKLLDATDALGVAVCHFFQGNQNQSKRNTWESFVKANPERVK